MSCKKQDFEVHNKDSQAVLIRLIVRMRGKQNMWSGMVMFVF